MTARDYCSVFILLSILCIAIPALLLLETSPTRIVHYTTVTTALNSEGSNSQVALTSFVSRDQFDGELERLGSYTRKTFSVSDDSHQKTNLSASTEPRYLVDIGSSRATVDDIATEKSELIFQKVRDIRSRLKKRTMLMRNGSVTPRKLRDSKQRMAASWERHHTKNESKGAVSISNHSLLSVEEMNEQRKTFVNQLFGKLGSRVVTLPPQCSDPLCTQYLVPYGWSEFNRCFQHSMRRTHRKLPLLDRCHFMNGTNRAPIALVSLPGSGNTWVRGLLEQATGICTGAVFCDSGLRSGGFNGEAVMSGATLVVKSHSMAPSWTKSEAVEFTAKGRQKFGSAVLLIRNPADAIIAEWNRRTVQEAINKTNSSHIGNAGKEYFGSNPEWNGFVERQAAAWRYYFTWVWRSTKDHRTLVVRYEDVKANASREVRRMLAFLGVLLTDKELQDRLAQGFDRFHRHHSDYEQFDHYTDRQKEYLKNVILQTYSTLQKAGYERACSIDEYYSNGAER